MATRALNVAIGAETGSGNPVTALRIGHRVAWSCVAISVAAAVIGSALPVRPPLGDLLFVWLMIGFTTAGALVAARHPDNATGWLLIAIGLGMQLVAVAPATHETLISRQPPLPGAGVVTVLFQTIWVIPVASLGQLFLRFPTGAPPTRRWWPVLGLTVAGAGLLIVAVPMLPHPIADLGGTTSPLARPAIASLLETLVRIGEVLVMLSVLAGLTALIARYRGADPVMRKQLQWLALAASALVAAYLAANVAEALGAPESIAPAMRSGALMPLPVACGVAILRYRLFDIDLVVSRLMLYGGLAGIVTLVYVATAVTFGLMAGGRGGNGALTPLVATAIAAVVLDPARRGLQRVANLLVYGRRATPYETLAAVTRRVAAGHAAAAVLVEMARGVGEAVGGRGEVWLVPSGSPAREVPELRREAVWPPEHHRPEGPAAPGTHGASFPITMGGVMVGMLTASKSAGDPLRPAEDRLLRDLARSAALVLDNIRLVHEMRDSRRRLVAAADQERRRVERDLHDGAQQRLLELLLTLHRAEQDLRDTDGDGARADTLGLACGQARLALAELRDLARGIHPAILTEQGLGPAVEALATRAPVSVELQLGLDRDRRLPPMIESTGYFVVSEAVANVLKHAQGAEVGVRITLAEETLTVDITDDGPGGADPGGQGLRGLADRVAAVGGELEVQSPAGGGTLVRANLPCG